MTLKQKVLEALGQLKKETTEPVGDFWSISIELEKAEQEAFSPGDEFTFLVPDPFDSAVMVSNELATMPARVVGATLSRKAIEATLWNLKCWEYFRRSLEELGHQVKATGGGYKIFKK